MLGQHYLEDVVAQFRALKRMADRALAQVSDEQFFAQLDPESNSLAMIVKHMAGNLVSRWTDFLTADGEKPDRQRDSEFLIQPGDTRAALAARWETGWQRLFTALAPLTADDLLRTIRIRGEGHTVVQAINRQLAHYADHVGQIVFLAKHHAGAQWKTLSIPRGQSDKFNQAMQRSTGPAAGLPGKAAWSAPCATTTPRRNTDGREAHRGRAHSRQAREGS
jgi:hypothetical protein